MCVSGAYVEDHSNNQCYFGNYCFRYDFLSDINEVDEEDCGTVCEKLASEVGFTGLSILHRLHRLNKFDVIKDMVFDTMHTLILQVVQRHLQFYLDKGYFRNSVFDATLCELSWTAGETCRKV